MISTAVNHDNGPHVSYFSVSWVDWFGIKVHTTVRLSIHSTRGSEVMYLESLNAYSFQSWPKKSCMLDIWELLYTKYPSKKTWMEPAMMGQPFAVIWGTSVPYLGQTTGLSTDPKASTLDWHDDLTRVSCKVIEYIRLQRSGWVSERSKYSQWSCQREAHPLGSRGATWVSCLSSDGPRNRCICFAWKRIYWKWQRRTVLACSMSEKRRSSSNG